MKKLYKLLLIAPVVLVMLGNYALAQNVSSKITPNKIRNADTTDISTVLTPHCPDAIFKTNAAYTFSVDNSTNNPQTGKVAYVVTDQFNKKLLADSVQISLGAQSTGDYEFTIPQDKAGFYKVSFMVNTNDYDDTTRRVFGIRPEEIKSDHPKPADFDQFWVDAKTELASVDPEYTVSERSDLEKDGRKVFLVSMKSLGGFTISAWLTEPKRRFKHQTFPVLIMLPGYQATNKPLLGKEYDMAFIGLDVRGQGLSRPGLDMRREDYIVSMIESKDNYILRGIIMDCIRAVDFVMSREELSHDRIAVTGGSMGGYLAITTAALDKRVSICAPQNPFMSDIYNMDHGAVQWPINHMKEYVKIRPGLTFPKVLENLQYFDTKNFAPNITCPVIMGIGLLDPFVPPNNSYAVYNSIPSKKKLFVFKDLGHEVGDKYYTYETLYTRDYFGLFM